VNLYGFRTYTAGSCCCQQFLWCVSVCVGVLGGWGWCGGMRRNFVLARLSFRIVFGPLYTFASVTCLYTFWVCFRCGLGVGLLLFYFGFCSVVCESRRWSWESSAAASATSVQLLLVSLFRTCGLLLCFRVVSKKLVIII